MERPLFIRFGDDRIRLSTIKTYGISWYGSARALKEANEDIYNDILDYVKEKFDIAPYHANHIVSSRYANYANSESDYVDKQVPEFYKCTKYLYIETFQGDCYEYYQVLEDFNIYNKLKELDSYLT